MPTPNTDPNVATAAQTFAITTDEPELKAALSLVYKAYLDSGLISTNQHELRVTPYHLLITTELLIAKIRGEVAATMTLVRDGELGLPLEAMFGSEVASRRQQGKKLVEISCLADRRASLERGFALLSRLMSFATQFGVSIGLEEALIAVHPRHAGFYQKFLGFDIIDSDVKEYEAVCGNPAVLLSLDLLRLQREQTPASRRLLGKTFSSSLFQRSPLSPELLAELTAIVADTYHDDLPSCDGEEEETEAGHESLPPPALAV